MLAAKEAARQAVIAKVLEEEKVLKGRRKRSAAIKQKSSKTV